jgi:nuclear pore complex protein Nup210
VIQALGSSGVKGSAMVMAEDKDTGLLLRADVIVDKIHSLKIVTKTHELYLEETPEKFEVRAYDEHGNEFSTLKGLKFRWTIESGGNAKGTDILRFMSWKDSPYNTEPILEKLESQGSQGNKVLLEGIKTGSAKVSVKLVDAQHSSVPAAVEPLMVVANLFLLPPAANIIPCASLDYTANQFRGNINCM